MGKLWRGELTLADAFWTHAILTVAVASIVATAASLLLLSAGVHGAVALAVHLLPVPYILVAIVGVWRSADRSSVPPLTASLARWAALLWGFVMAVL